MGTGMFLCWPRIPEEQPVLGIRMRDPVPFLTSGSGMGKKSGSGMNNPDHISESLETIFWAKTLEFFDADPGSGMENIRIWDEKNLYPGLTYRIRNTGINRINMVRLGGTCVVFCWAKDTGGATVWNR
jgi:hypothetical protein